ncbi:anaerobic sulfite reductase subunit AsrB [Pectobacteriaceae bacterium CE90]|nr:anaerobic sulfite reductase subunit AsrB [Pectobacteriaceae bacterium CE90]
MSEQCQCERVQDSLMPQPCTILAIEKHTELEWNFRISTDLPARFGQFVEVSLPLVGEAPISVSDCGPGWMDLLIRDVGKVTSALFQLDVGDAVWIRGCYGNGYPLERFYGRPLLVVAGGTGVAPVKGLLRHFNEHPGLVSQLDMILGYKNRQSVLYREEMANWSNVDHLILTLDEGEADERFQIGRVTDVLATLPLSDIEQMQVIVVGPPIMIQFTVRMLLERGIAPAQIWVDYERRMACATGKCGHCRIGKVYVCVDGPVFNYADARHLID